MLICEDAMILSVPSPLVGDFPSFWELGVAQLVAENFEDEEGGADAGEVEEGVLCLHILFLSTPLGCCSWRQAPPGVLGLSQQEKWWRCFVHWWRLKYFW